MVEFRGALLSPTRSRTAQEAHDLGMRLREQGGACTRLFYGGSIPDLDEYALQVAAVLLCLSDENPPCGTCQSCRYLAGNWHPDFHHIQPQGAGNRIKIDKVRDDLIKQSLQTPHTASRRVFLLSQAECVRDEAANCMLKTLEEPPGPVVIMLTTTRPDRLLPTILSRCQQLRVPPSALEEVAARVDLDVHDPEAQALHHLSGGYPALAALMNDVGVLQARLEAVDLLREIAEGNLWTVEGRVSGGTALWEAAAALEWPHLTGDARPGGQAVARKAMRLLYDFWGTVAWDIVKIHKGLPAEELFHADLEADLRKLAGMVPVTAAEKLVRTVSVVTERLEQNVNPRLLLDNVLLSVREDIERGR